jgi:signal transduction histidine kinase
MECESSAGKPADLCQCADVTRQKQLEREILEVADWEKERLGRELHDGLCQTLAGVAALSMTLSRTLPESSKSSADAAEISQLINEAIGDARDMARGLGPIGIGEVGLEGVLEELSVSIRHQFQIDCSFEYAVPSLSLCEGSGAHLYRIVQEAVNNAIVHGRANRIEIGLGLKGEEGLLSIRDNGAGLHDEEPDGGGAGRHTMAYRSRLIGGSLELRRRSLRGTAVICTFPLCPRPDSCEPPDQQHSNS